MNLSFSPRLRICGNDSEQSLIEEKYVENTGATQTHNAFLIIWRHRPDTIHIVNIVNNPPTWV